MVKDLNITKAWGMLTLKTFPDFIFSCIHKKSVANLLLPIHKYLNRINLWTQQQG